MTADARTAAVLTAVLLLGVLVLAGLLLSPRLPGYVKQLRGALPAAGDFSSDERLRGQRLRRELRPLSYARLLLNLGVAVLFGATAAGAWLIEAVARPFGGGWYWQAALGVLVLLVLGLVVGLPLGVAGERILRREGLSVQPWSSWALDRLKGLLLGWLLLGLAAEGGYALIRAAPNWWWTVGAVLAAALAVLLSFVFPVLVEPIFARFAPMSDGPLRDALLEMARHDGVPVRDVLVADASRRTTALNAYVSGFGRTRRIVVFDTLLETASEDEVRLVVAHELGHAAERDVLVGTALGACAAALGTVLVALALSSSVLLDAADVADAADPRGLGLVLLITTVLGLLSGPLSNAASRRIEARADLHSLELTGDPLSFVASERRLALTNVADLTPSRVAYLLFASHPTVPERIATARRWAEERGLPVPGPLLDPAGPLPAAPGGAAG